MTSKTTAHHIFGVLSGAILSLVVIVSIYSAIAKSANFSLLTTLTTPEDQADIGYLTPEPILWEQLNIPVSDGGQGPYGYYNLLTDAFLQGQVHLLINPPPVNPASGPPILKGALAQGLLHDGALYQGKYYLYFGWPPSVFLFLPLRLLGIKITDAGATIAFLTGFLCLACWMSYQILKDYFTNKQMAVLVPITLFSFGLQLGIPYFVSRPAVYEVAIASGLFFGFLSFSLLFYTLLPLSSQKHMRDSMPWTVLLLAASGVSLGLCISSRPTLLPLLIITTGLIAYLGYSEKKTLTSIMMQLVSFFVAVASVLGVTFYYNYIRFGSPFDFGVEHVVTNFGQINNPDSLFRFSNLWPNIFMQLLQAPRLTALFPFFQPSNYPFRLPDWFYGSEQQIGGLFFSPFLVFGAIAGIYSWKYKKLAFPGSIIILSLTATGIFILLFESFLFPGSTQRYQLNSMPYLGLSLLTLSLIVFRRFPPTASALLKNSLAFILGFTILSGIILNLLMSLSGPTNTIKRFNYELYMSIESKFDYLSGLVTALTLAPQEPVILDFFNTGSIHQEQDAILSSCPFVLVIFSAYDCEIDSTFALDIPDLDRLLAQNLIALQLNNIKNKEITNIPLNLSSGNTISLALPLKKGINRFSFTFVNPTSTSNQIYKIGAFKFN